MLKSKKSTYLDYNATVPVLNDVKASIIECMNLGPLNASSVHSFGRKGKNIIYFLFLFLFLLFSKDFIFFSKIFTFSINRFKVFSLGSISLVDTA